MVACMFCVLGSGNKKVWVFVCITNQVVTIANQTAGLTESYYVITVNN